jgi:hypothetical protein
MHYNATLCKKALEKKLLAQVAKRTCFCFELWASSLPNGYFYSHLYNKKFLANRQSA